MRGNRRDMTHVKERETRWHLSMIPLYMAIGNPGLLVTLVALSLGASVAQIGAISASGSVASFVFSMIWGRLSDMSSRRKVYLLFFALILVPLFAALSLVIGIPEITTLYTLIIAISSGVAPIAVMYTVECCGGKDWSNEVARVNSIMSIGNIAGLLIFTLAANYYPTQSLFYISAAACLASTISLWRLGKEPEMTFERHSFSKILHDVEGLLSPRPLLQHLNIRKIRPPTSLRRLSSIQLLLLTAFIHWTGISIYSIGMTPLMKALGLSDSIILALNVVNGIAAAVSFIWIVPRAKNGSKHLKELIIARAILVLCWAPLPLFILNPPTYVFIFPMIISAVINVLYAMLWLPLSSFAISSAPEDRKSSVVGQLISATAIAGALGSAVGGILITLYGYSVGFIIASIIMLLATQTVTRINSPDAG
ncbi:MAG: MFS transporter [Candidatus Bathyarchaeia archaeon]